MLIYTAVEEKKAIYIFKSLKQLKAAAHWTSKQAPTVKHYKTGEHKRPFIKEMTARGYQVFEARPPQPYEMQVDFYLPLIEAPYLLKGFLY